MLFCALTVVCNEVATSNIVSSVNIFFIVVTVYK
jgi:hypothetical protein